MTKQYLIDTNICIYLLKKQHGIAQLLNKAGRENCYISDITLAELYYGASRSGQKEKKMEGVRYVEEYFTVLPIHEVLEKFGDCKALLKSNGQLIDDFDLLIGATAVVYNLIMVTENVKHLARIPGIHVENWVKRAT